MIDSQLTPFMLVSSSGRDHDYRSGPKDDYYRDDDVNQQRQVKKGGG